MAWELPSGAIRGQHCSEKDFVDLKGDFYSPGFCDKLGDLRSQTSAKRGLEENFQYFTSCGADAVSLDVRVEQ